MICNYDATFERELMNPMLQQVQQITHIPSSVLSFTT